MEVHVASKNRPSGGNQPATSGGGDRMCVLAVGVFEQACACVRICR